MKIAVVQLAYGDEESPTDRVARVVDLVGGLAGHDLVILPELWMPTGFGYQGWDALAEPLDGPWAEAMAAAARSAGLTLHAGSYVERLASPGPEGRDLSNTSVVFGPDGSQVAVYRKIHRFGFGTGEPKLMEAGVDVVLTDVPYGDGQSVTAGLSTCYDLRFPELYRLQLDEGAELLLVPAAWPAARVAHWSLLGRARAVENQCFVVACNTGGTHGGAPMGGHSQVVSPMGAILAEATDNAERILSVEIDLGDVADYRTTFPVLADRRI